MLHSPLFSLSFCFVFFFFFIILIPQQNCSPLPLSRHRPNPKHFPVGVDLASISHAANFQGLAIVAMELAVENASNTVLKIANMMNSGTFDHHDMGCLEDCMETYSHSVTALLNSIGAFMAKHYGVANTWMLQVTKGTRRCELGFSRGRKEASPLKKENSNILRLSDIALCIIQFLEPPTPPRSS
ncbi:putative invertase inhibitor [Vitis vinifera]|uniref:Putative invertase inhibitor n=1 Tax=Vitis vinifera TaxID=29760 RepID=A0A438K010_VITVI|nr:putative invertase inhibitor [Vitis vinifera]